MGKIKVWVGPVVHKSILMFFIYARVDQATVLVTLTNVKKNTSISTLQIIYIFCRSSCGMSLVQYV